MNDVSPKVTAGASGGAVVVIVVWILNITAHLNPPPEVIAALTVLVSAAAGWATPDRLRDLGKAHDEAA